MIQQRDNFPFFPASEFPSSASWCAGSSRFAETSDFEDRLRVFGLGETLSDSGLGPDAPVGELIGIVTCENGAKI